VVADGSPGMGNGSGNGAPLKANKVTHSALYDECCAEIEAKHPRVARERFFERLDAFMVICDVEADAYHVGGATFYMQTPEDFSPILMIYFTHAAGQIVMQAVHADD
jgi:hypothetical protein